MPYLWLLISPMLLSGNDFLSMGGGGGGGRGASRVLKELWLRSKSIWSRCFCWDFIHFINLWVYTLLDPHQSFSPWYGIQLPNLCQTFPDVARLETQEFREMLWSAETKSLWFSKILLGPVKRANLCFFYFSPFLFMCVGNPSYSSYTL